MKKIIPLIILSFMSISCDKRIYTIKVVSGEGLLVTENWIKCDSVDMISTKEANIYIDGRMSNIKATKYITVKSN